MKRIFLAVLMVFVCIQGVWASDAITPEKVAQIESEVQKAMAELRVPGLSLVMVADGQVVYTGSFGVLKQGEAEQVNADTIFQIASVSKTFTSFAIMQLLDQGRIQLDDPVVQYLPWFTSKDAENAKKITIKHLLQHTSGIPTQAYGLELANGSMDQLQEQLRQLSQIQLQAVPGTKHIYSHFNYWTLAMIVEAVTGMPFAEYMQQNLFQPMEMSRTGYLLQGENIATGHRLANGKVRPLTYTAPGTTLGSDGVQTTANDMGKYLLTLLGQGTYNGKTLVSSESIHAMHNDTIQLDDTFSYGYGWVPRKNLQTLCIGHAANYPHFVADIVLIPAYNAGFALMANTGMSDLHQLTSNIRRVILNDTPIPVKPLLIRTDALTVKGILAASIVLTAIALIYLIRVRMGLKRGSCVIFQGRPSKARLLLQIILLPVISCMGIVVVWKLPALMIGSRRLAALYKPDLVGSAWWLMGSLLFFGITVGVLGFVKKRNIPTSKGKAV